MAETTERGSQTKIIAWIGAVVGLVSAFGVLYGIFHKTSTEIPDYQRQVIASCKDVNRVVTADHGLEIIQFDDSPDFGDPTSFALVRKDALLRVMQQNLDAVRERFRLLNERSAPKQLNEQKHRAESAQQNWYAVSEDAIRTIEKQVQDRDPFQKTQTLLSGPRITQAGLGLNEAMTALAGSECKAIG
jgi:hypothetical protein